LRHAGAAGFSVEPVHRRRVELSALGVAPKTSPLQRPVTR
jgi:hypothetical protein